MHLYLTAGANLSTCASNHLTVGADQVVRDASTSILPVIICWCTLCPQKKKKEVGWASVLWEVPCLKSDRINYTSLFFHVIILWTFISYITLQSTPIRIFWSTKGEILRHKSEGQFQNNWLNLPLSCPCMLPFLTAPQLFLLEIYWLCCY